jgi:endoglucanase
MKKKILLLILGFCFFLVGFGQENGNSIKVNTLGYKLESVKKATINGLCNGFKVVDTSNKKVVFKGKLKESKTQDDVDQSVFIADFSALNTPGNYYIETKSGLKSVVFKIADDCYDFAFKTSMRAFYLWRCGTEVEGVFEADTFKQEACHMHDGYLDFTEFGEKQKDGTGGWHDAGDYGKYIVNGGISLGQLFMGWQDFQKGLEKTAFDIPDKHEKMPDYLEELKWETDWFLKMQYSDNSGRVSHKLTRTSFSGFIMPNEDTAKRYFTEWGTAATAHFVGAMAIAARNFEPYDAEYAKTCLDAAKRSYKYLQENSEYVRWGQKDFHTGGYQPNQTGGLIWAAAEMWETTGEDQYLKDFELRLTNLKELVDYNWDWGNVRNLGVYTYLLSEKKGRNKELHAKIKQEMIHIADSIVSHTKSDVYGRPSALYEWGCNGTIARLASNLYVASKLNPDKKYKEAAESIVAHIFGRNYYGRSYVTGLGVNPPMFPHDRRCGADGIKNPWPGYIVGGGHTATDWVDEEGSYSHNEICINWQASLVYLMAWVAME